MRRRAIVIGAGIAGLSCAFDLARAGVEVQVLDARSHVGGVMTTHGVDGFLFEEGPNSIPSSAEAFRGLCRDAGLEQRLVSSSASARTRFLFFRGRLQPLPTSPRQLLATRLLSFPAKVRLLTEPWRRWRPLADDADPTFDAFLTERFGREVARTLGGSFVRGIYASEASELGTASAFPRLWELAHAHGGVLRGLRGQRRANSSAAPAASRAGPGRMDLLSLDGGLGTLPAALAEALGERVRLGVTATAVVREGEGWHVETQRGAPLAADHVVLATPASPSARLLENTPLAPHAAAALEAVEHASVVVVSLGFDRDFLPAGFGFLVPPDESRRGRAPHALGVLFLSKMFEGRAPHGSAAVSAIYRAEDVTGLQEDELVERARQDLEIALAGERVPQPSARYIRRWRNAIPRYGPGHRARIAAVIEALARHAPGLHLIGSFRGGVSVDDRIRLGRECATRVAAAHSVEGVA